MTKLVFNRCWTENEWVNGAQIVVFEPSKHLGDVIQSLEVACKGYVDAVVCHDIGTVRFFSEEEVLEGDPDCPDHDDYAVRPGGLRRTEAITLRVNRMGEFWWEGYLKHTAIHFYTSRMKIDELLDLPCNKHAPERTSWDGEIIPTMTDERWERIMRGREACVFD